MSLCDYDLGNTPRDIPSCPDRLYGRTGEWTGWPDWLGTKVERPAWRSYEEARAFLEDMRRLGRVPATFPTRWIGHAYRVYAWAGPRLRDDGVLLAGDAAGLAYPASGEGILPAVVSGQLAAKAADEDLRSAG